MFYLLLESILTYGNLDENTNILVYTSTEFMNTIKESNLFSDKKIFFEINDTYNDIDKACKSRLDLFDLQSVNNYNKILYLDTDIVIKDDINKIFDVCKDDILYVLEEGSIDCDYDYYGGLTLFGDEVNNYSDKTAFSSGVMLFNNCEKIKDLFYKIKEDIVNRPYFFNCYDQPYIVYNAFKYNLYNNKILKSFVVNNDNVYSDKVIHHFPGGPGIYQRKIDEITVFLNKLKYGDTLNIEDNTSKNFVNNLQNKTYTWEDSQIKFLEDFTMDAFGPGSYSFVDKQNILAVFGGREHNISFNDTFTEFSSTRIGDSEVVNGSLIE